MSQPSGTGNRLLTACLAAVCLCAPRVGMAGDASCSAVAVREPILWTAAGKSVESWDLRMTRRARLSVNPLPVAPLGLVALPGDLALALCGSDGGFLISTRNSTPAWLAAPKPVLGAAERNGLLATACGGRGVFFFALTNPVAPVLLGGFSAASDARAVGFVASLACVADGANGLKFLDASQPTKPELVGVFAPVAQPSADLLAISTTLIATAHGKQVRLLDASDPRHPVVTATCDLPAEARGMAAGKLHLWVACGLGGLVELDMAHALKELARHPTDGPAVAITAEGTRVFVAQGEGSWRELSPAR